MAKKKLGYVELEWTCPSCGSRNPGTVRVCGSCGDAMPEDVEFVAPAGAELDTSKETAAKVEAGPDIHCPYCGTRNPATATNCSQCGGELSGGERRKKGKVVGAYKTGPVPEVTCPHCGATNPGSAVRCSSCGGVLAAPEAKEAAAAEKPAAAGSPAKGGIGRLGCIIAIVAVAAIVGLMIFLTQGSTESVATVTDVEWAYTVAIEGLMPVTHEAWWDEVPSGAELTGCEKRIRSVQADPVPGATEVCGTPYIVDTGTGKGEVTQDCEYHVPGDWCSYTLLQWVSLGQEQVASGYDLNPQWPVFSLAADQREGERSQTYKVTLLAEDEEYIYRPSDLQEYQQFRVGSEWNIETNRLGGVTSVSQAD